MYLAPCFSLYDTRLQGEPNTQHTHPERSLTAIVCHIRDAQWMHHGGLPCPNAAHTGVPFSCFVNENGTMSLSLRRRSGGSGSGSGSGEGKDSVAESGGAAVDGAYFVMCCLFCPYLPAHWLRGGVPPV